MVAGVNNKQGNLWRAAVVSSNNHGMVDVYERALVAKGVVTRVR